MMKNALRERIAVAVTVAMVCAAPFLAGIVHAIEEALEQTVSYIVIRANDSDI